MGRETIFQKYPIYFFIMYAFTSGAGAAYSFMPVYLKHIGFNDTLIGTLLAVGPLMAILAQPFWGMAGDRAKSKNQIFRLIMIGSSVLVLLHPLSKNFYYIFIVMSLFCFFNNSMWSIQDVIALESIEKTGWKYGAIRMAGTIGYAALSVPIGSILYINIYFMFPLFVLFAFFSWAATYKIPNIKGHQSEGEKVSPVKLLKHKQLVLLTIFTFFIFLTLSYYSSFSTIYFKQIGADNFLIGITMFISSAAEIPFLLFADRIVKKLTLKGSLILSGFVMGLRWLLIYLIKDVYLLLPVNLLHGFSFIVCTYCMATYINQEVPKELRASGQTLYGLFAATASRVVASIVGGAASDAFGIRNMFLYCSIINLVVLAVFGAVFIISRNNNKNMSENFEV